MTRFAVCVLLFAVACSVGGRTGAAPVPKHLLKEAPPPAGLAGVWKLESIKQDGKAIFGAPSPMTWEIGVGVVVQVARAGGMDEAKFTAILTHDPDQKQFFALKSRDAAGQVVHSDVGYGYAIKGDQLTLATIQGANLAFTPANPLAPSPEDFVLVLTRVKK